jgi:hypothetical protein
VALIKQLENVTAAEFEAAMSDWVNGVGIDLDPPIAFDVATQFMLHHIKAQRNRVLDQFLQTVGTDDCDPQCWECLSDAELGCEPDQPTEYDIPGFGTIYRVGNKK